MKKFWEAMSSRGGMTIGIYLALAANIIVAFMHFGWDWGRP